MKYDGLLDLATGRSAKSKVWKNVKLDWSELVHRLTIENKTNETFKEFLAANKEEQLNIKDVGGYVGGYLRSGRRNPTNVVHRQILTLDIDFAHIGFFEDFQIIYDNAAVIHATHKHSPESPRLRLIMPLSEPVGADKYAAISRWIAGSLGIELFDKTTFEVNRLMFWPSSPKDVEYYYEVQDGPWIDVEEILSYYNDWTDSSLWPTADREIQAVEGTIKKQEDPAQKKGLVGAFCRTYSIEEAIEVFLSEDYKPSAIENRYTYVKGSTAAGLLIYGDKFAYSHHGTDPASGKLCNAFDLVRLHKFGHLDEDRSSKTSFTKMEALILKDKKVKKTIAAESLGEARFDFAEDEPATIINEDDLNWTEDLDVNTRGEYLSSATNVNLIFANDIRLKGLFRKNDFDARRYVFGNLPWRKVEKPEVVKNVDYSGVRNYIESIYGISGALKIDDSLALEFERNAYNPVKQYLASLKWDGKKRVDTLLIDYFGAEDNVYTRDAIRKMLAGAVARVFKPGCKFDLVLTLVGEQGSGKSTFVKTLGGPWFSDTFLTVHGKEALEQIQGAWLIEIAELSGLRKAEVEAVKHFISKQEDVFRPAYARSTETYRRQCVFFGTTNNKDFLRDPSGNRRFLPIDVNSAEATKNIFTEFKDEVDQIWAEAYQIYRKGEKLYMEGESEEIAKLEQERHSELDERRGIIERYLETEFPNDWEKKDIYERRLWLNDPLTAKNKKETLKRKNIVCVAEIWSECLEKNKEQLDRYKARELNDIMRSIPGWRSTQSTRRFSFYGVQRYYERIREEAGE